MSSLLKEEMQKLLFRPERQRLDDFIEIEEPVQGRHFLCVSVAKSKEVQISVVQYHKSQHSGSKNPKRSQDSYHRTEAWPLQDLALLDGRDPDIDDPCFLMHFNNVHSVREVIAVSCAAKYSLARALFALSNKHCHGTLVLKNFDWAYIQPSSIYSTRGDCMILMHICFYAFNLVCLSMCPMP